MIPDELTKDLQILKEAGYSFEVVEEGPRIYVVFKSYKLPPGLFNVDTSDLMVFTTQQYPNASLDMFWVDEKLSLKNGGTPKSADQLESYLGRRWRRFSYHPFNNRPWNPAEDSVVSYMSYVDQRLGRGD